MDFFLFRPNLLIIVDIFPAAAAPAATGLASLSPTPPKMSEGLVKQLASYKAQLHQVGAALSGNRENEDLLKL